MISLHRQSLVQLRPIVNVIVIIIKEQRIRFYIVIFLQHWAFFLLTLTIVYTAMKTYVK